jgi:hypothetical protein
VRAFAADPACAQAQLWRRVARDRALSAASLTQEQDQRRQRAVADQDLARAMLLQAETRVEQAEGRVAGARRAIATRLEERAGEDIFIPGTRQ